MWKNESEIQVLVQAESKSTPVEHTSTQQTLRLLHATYYTVPVMRNNADKHVLYEWDEMVLWEGGGERSY